MDNVGAYFFMYYCSVSSDVKFLVAPKEEAKAYIKFVSPVITDVAEVR